MLRGCRFSIPSITTPAGFTDHFVTTGVSEWSAAAVFRWLQICSLIPHRTNCCVIFACEWDADWRTDLFKDRLSRRLFVFSVAVAVGWLHTEKKLVNILVLQCFNFTIMSSNSPPMLQLSLNYLINLSLSFNITEFNNILFEFFSHYPLLTAHRNKNSIKKCTFWPCRGYVKYPSRDKVLLAQRSTAQLILQIVKQSENETVNNVEQQLQTANSVYSSTCAGNP